MNSEQNQTYSDYCNVYHNIAISFTINVFILLFDRFLEQKKRKREK